MVLFVQLLQTYEPVNFHIFLYLTSSTVALQTVQTQIRELLWEPSDLGLHCTINRSLVLGELIVPTNQSILTTLGEDDIE